MPNLSSIARPYALAAFEFARDKKQLPSWITFLKSAAYIAKQPEMAKLLANPQTSPAQLHEVFVGTLGAELTIEQKNFLSLLSQHNRFIALPEIADLFMSYYAQLEKTSTVRVITAVEATQAFKEKLTRALSARTQREVSLECEVDPSIIGGAVIQFDDSKVIDASVRGKLNRMLETLTSS